VDLERAAHTIKSSCRNLGATLAQQAATRLEDAARLMSEEAVPALLADLEAAIATVKPVLEAKRAAMSPSNEGK